MGWIIELDRFRPGICLTRQDKYEDCTINICVVATKRVENEEDLREVEILLLTLK